MNRRMMFMFIASGSCAFGAALPFTGVSVGPAPEIAAAKAAGRVVRIELPPLQRYVPTPLELPTSLAQSNTSVNSGLPLVQKLQAPTVGDSDPRTFDYEMQPGGSARAAVETGFLDLRFNLANLSSGPEQSGNSFEVQKKVRFNGAEAGQLTIRVSAGSALYVSRDELRVLLDAAKNSELVAHLAGDASTPFVGFDQIRESGLNVRYDPILDRILLTT